MRDPIVMDDQCPITFRRCDRPCGTECIRGMFTPHARPELTEVVLGGVAAALAAAEARGVARGRAEMAAKVRVVMDRLNSCRALTTDRPGEARAYDDGAEWLRRLLADTDGEQP